MENKMLMPATYRVMTESEMTYTEGGGVFLALTVPLGIFCIAAVAINAHMTDAGLREGSQWVEKHYDLESEELESQQATAFEELENSKKWPNAGIAFISGAAITMTYCLFTMV